MTTENPFDRISRENGEVLTLLRQMMQQPAGTETARVEKPVGIKEAAEYLMLSPAAVYANLDKIPSHKRHKQRYFFLSELEAYVKAGISDLKKT